MIEGGVGEHPQVPHPVGHARLLQVVEEDLMIVGGLVFEPVDLLGPTIVAGVRIDRHDLDARRSGTRQHDRRAAAEAADLDDQSAGRATGRRVVQRRRLPWRHPAVDVGDGLHDSDQASVQLA